MADWALLDGARLSRLATILQHLRNNREFLRQALETDAKPESFIPHMASPRAFSGHRDPSPPAAKEFHLRTKEKVTAFMSMHDVSIHLKTLLTDAGASSKAEPLNLTASLFDEYLGHAGSSVGSGGVPYPRGQGSKGVTRLFESEPFVSTGGLGDQRGRNGAHARSPLPAPGAVPPLALVPVPPPLTKMLPAAGTPVEIHEEEREKHWGPEATAEVIEVLDEDEPPQPETQQDEGAVIPPVEEAGPPSPQGVLQLQKNGGPKTLAKGQVGLSPRTPLAAGAVGAVDDEEESERDFYFNVEWRVQGAPPVEPKEEASQEEKAQHRPSRIYVNGLKKDSAPLAISQGPPKEMVEQHKGAQLLGETPGRSQTGVPGGHPEDGQLQGEAPRGGNSSQAGAHKGSPGAASAGTSGEPGGGSSKQQAATAGRSRGPHTSGSKEAQCGSSKGQDESRNLMKEASSLRVRLPGYLGPP